MKKLTSPLFAALLVAVSSISASAIMIDPQYTTFGKLSAADFGGNGIPNTSVAITTIGDVTLGLSASARYDNPTVTDNGAGTFYATAGNDAAHGQPDYARWNFDFYISGISFLGSPLVALYYDTNPAVGNAVTDSIWIPVSAQDSWNLGMDFIGGSFNPSAPGEYDFALVATNYLGAETGRVAITVTVGSVTVPDTATTLSLLGLSMVGLIAFGRRFGAK